MKSAVALLTTFLLAAPASAQVVDPPPPADEVGYTDNWTYVVMPLLGWAALAFTALIAVGYVLKAREFKANQRRGGSK